MDSKDNKELHHSDETLQEEQELKQELNKTDINALTQESGEEEPVLEESELESVEEEPSLEEPSLEESELEEPKQESGEEEPVLEDPSLEEPKQESGEEEPVLEEPSLEEPKQESGEEEPVLEESSLDELETGSQTIMITEQRSSDSSKTSPTPLKKVGYFMGLVVLIATFLLMGLSTIGGSALTKEEVNTIISTWVKGDDVLDINVDLTDLTASTVMESQLFSGLEKYIPKTFNMTGVIDFTEEGLDSQFNYISNNNPVELDIKTTEDGVYVNTDGIINSVRKHLTGLHLADLNKTVRGKWLNINEFRSLIEVDSDSSNTKQVSSINKQHQVEQLLKSLTDEQVTVITDKETGKKEFEITLNTEESNQVLSILTGTTDMSNFIQGATGTLNITDESLTLNLQTDILVYGLQLKGRLTATVTRSKARIAPTTTKLEEIDSKTFIGYFFRLVKVEKVKFTEEEYNTIIKVIKEELTNMSDTEKKDLLSGLEKDLFTEEQYKEISQLLTKTEDSSSEESSSESSEDIKEEREKRFRELEELIRKKEVENTNVYQAPPRTSTPATQRPATPNTSTSEESKPAESKPVQESKPEESKPVQESKPEESKPVQESKPEESVPVESKPVQESKPEESVPVESKPVESVPVESKPVESTPAPVQESAVVQSEAVTSSE